MVNDSAPTARLPNFRSPAQSRVATWLGVSLLASTLGCTGLVTPSPGSGPSADAAADDIGNSTDAAADDQPDGTADGGPAAIDAALPGAPDAMPAADASLPASPCDDPGLEWRSANKTNYESYPDPGSEECIEYNGCEWAGQFAYCDGVFPEEWVAAHNIASVFPSTGLVRHDLCLRKGTSTIIVTAIDTCGDSDCGGCCTENLGSADRLIDLEKYTNQRWGVQDGAIEWADLGPNPAACD